MSSRCSDYADSGLDVQPLCFRVGWFCFLSEPNIWHFGDDEETEAGGGGLLLSLLSEASFVQHPACSRGMLWADLSLQPLTLLGQKHTVVRNWPHDPPQSLCTPPWLHWVTGYLMALGESDWHGQECSYALTAWRNQLCVQFLDIAQV